MRGVREDSGGWIKVPIIPTGPIVHLRLMTLQQSVNVAMVRFASYELPFKVPER